MMKETLDALERIGKDEMKSTLRIQTTLLKAMQQFMAEKGFMQFMPIMTSPLTDPLGPDPGSTVIKTGEIEYYGQQLVVTQSMILHKQLAMASGLDKMFVFSPNLRLEHEKRKETGKHLFEFTQMDFEMSKAEMKDAMDLIEELVVESIKAVTKERKDDLETLGRKLSVPMMPFKFYTTHQLEEKYGKDWEITASKDHDEPFWAICHKREFYDKEDPKEKGHYKNYDLIWPEGFGEALSGAEREFDYDIIKRKIGGEGVPLGEERLKHYMFLSESKLLVPSAGGGIGVERFVRFLTGRKHIGEVQPFIRVPGEKVIF